PARSGDRASRRTGHRRAAGGPHRDRHRPPSGDGAPVRRHRHPRAGSGRRAGVPHRARRGPGLSVRRAAAQRARAGARLMTDDTVGTGRFLWRMATYRTGTYLADTICWVGVYGTQLLPGLVAQRAFDAVQHDAADVPAILWFAALFVGAGI